MKNILRTPWRVEENSRHLGLFNVYNCDGNLIVIAKIEEVARFIAAAPELKKACLTAAEQVQALRNAISALESVLYAVLEPISLDSTWTHPTDGKDPQ